MAKDLRVGWIGCGRMGSAMAKRLLAGPSEVWVTNRTRAKAEALGELGAVVVDHPIDLADRDVVFVMVSADPQLLEVLSGPRRCPGQRRRRATDRHRLFDRVDRERRPPRAKSAPCGASSFSPLR